ncbi:phytoene desaturase family protein [Nocardia sp. NPDC059246]|uniref:phytoene desaturase family protein n=1 Tax=unclassified Nocardia TaxID=2637762 RepID=UPI003696DB0E
MTAIEWDYIVVGAGHNGLSAACTLGEQGRSVLVVDQLPFLGGLSASVPWVPEAPDHLLSVGAMDDMFMAQTPLARELGLERHGYEPIPLEAPYGWINEDGDTLLLFRDFDRTLSEIRRFSRKDAQTYAELRPVLDLIMDLVDQLSPRHPSALGKRDLAKLALKLAPDRKARSMLGKMLTLSVFEMISETFDSDAMRGLWAYWTSMIGPADLDSTGMFLMAYHALHRKQGVLRPRGGMTGLMNAFASKVRSHGGEIRLDSKVEQILVEGGRAVGVRLVDGSELRSRHGVLANCAPQVALGPLLPDGVLDRETRNKVAMIPANSVNVASFKIDFAVRGRVDFPTAAAKRPDKVDVRRTTLMTGTLEEHMASLKATKLGVAVDNPPVYMAVLSAADPTIAPPGQDVLYLHANVPADPVGGWEANRDVYTQTIVKSAQRFLDGLDAEIGRVVHTPKDFEDRFSTPKGCYFHVDMTPLRLGVNRPARGLGGYVTPVAGLYLAGAGSHPGGTVNGWCGRLAAFEAVKHEN